MNKKAIILMIACMVILPTLSESIYSPALPLLSSKMGISASLAEITLTVYLIGYAIGMMMWGNASDRIGRRPALILGFSIYALSCLLCWTSCSYASISGLLISRFFQALGGSAGSVIGQAICRDSFDIQRRSQVMSIVGTSIAAAPAFGPLVGYIVGHQYGFTAIFMLLFCLGSVLLSFIAFNLPETRPQDVPPPAKVFTGMRMVFRQPKTLIYALMTGLSTGVGFCYFAESPFIFQNLLHLEKFHAYSFLFIGLSWVIGGQISYRLSKKGMPAHTIMQYGAYYSSLASLLTVFVLLFLSATENPMLYGSSIIAGVVLTMVALGLVIPNAISLGIEPYRENAGTAASVFGFTYYSTASILTFLIASFRTNNAIFMSEFFFLMCMSLVLCNTAQHKMKFATQ